ncbi:MAG: hypothetical protein AAGA48_29105 [Myxococcota bacterium]
MPFLWALLLGCTSTIQVYGAPKGAEIYVTKQPPTPTMKPAVTLAGGKLPNFTYTGNYLAWETLYLWISAPGYETQVVRVPNDAKIGPIIGGIFCLFPFIWAVGPTETPINVELPRK